MKDKVFIIWSGSIDVALKVKSILESQYNYVCCIGGNSDNESTFASVGDTVIQQMKTCNQAIVLFQNRADGAISNNLFFELGYVSAKYGMKKVHCVRRLDESITLPSDFDNAFVEYLPADTDDIYAANIIDYFIKRQKMSIDANKMQLINNRYIMHDMLQAHYSSAGSRCSDYELAQYVLFYMQAAVMLEDEENILRELRDFKRLNHSSFSPELILSVNLSIAFLEVQVALISEGDLVYISDDTFRHYYSVCNDMLDDVESDDAGTFDEWTNVFLAENLAYVTALYAMNPSVNDQLRLYLSNKVVDYGKRCIESIERLEKVAPIVENNDNMGLVLLYKAYIFRHLFTAYRFLGQDDEALFWLQASLKERKMLLRTYDGNSIDSKIYSSFQMEYYLSLMEYLSYRGKESVDEFTYMMYLNEVDSYIDDYSHGDMLSAYFRKIVNVRKAMQ